MKGNDEYFVFGWNDEVKKKTEQYMMEGTGNEYNWEMEEYNWKTKK